MFTKNRTVYPSGFTDLKEATACGKGFSVSVKKQLLNTCLKKKSMICLRPLKQNPMIMKKSLLGFLSLALLATVSCKKTDSSSDVTMANVAGSYKLTAMTVKLGANPEADYMSSMDPCEKDNIMALNANGNYTVTDAGTVCTPSGSSTGTWSLPTTTSIVTKETGFTEGDTATIKSFNGSQLVLTENVDFGGQTGVVTSTMSKQ
jgi:hypothetical protein